MNKLNSEYLSQVAGGCFCSCYEAEGENIILINKGVVNNEFTCIIMCLKKAQYYNACSEMKIMHSRYDDGDSEATCASEKPERTEGSESFVLQ